VERDLPNPDRDQLSVMAALVLLSYTLARLVVLPTIGAEFTILGLLVRFEINTHLIMLALAAALTTAGAAWLLGSHPNASAQRSTAEHWVIPGLAALGVGAILSRVPLGPGLGVGLALAAALLVAVFVAEFIVFDPTDPRYDAASLGLRSLAYLLLIGVIFAIQATDIRAVYAIPIVMVCGTAVAWRLLRLGVPQASVWRYALLSGFVTTQLAWGLHYWPTSPLQQALILGLVAYLGEGFLLAHLQEGITPARALELAALSGLVLMATVFAA
jgi:hypothetical protein